MTSREVITALRATFKAPEYALIEEVGNATGSNCSRHADALVMSLWPSRGLHLHGFEVKVSRSDLKRELAQPAKAEAVARYCHFWYIACPAGLCKSEDLPHNWGLYEIEDGKAKRTKAAVPLDPAPLNYSILAAIMRKLADGVYTPGEQALKEAESKGWNACKRTMESSLDIARKSERNAQGIIAAFRRASFRSLSDERTAAEVGKEYRAMAEASRSQLESLIRQRTAIDQAIRTIEEYNAKTEVPA